MVLHRYSDRELQVFLWVILPYTAGMNLIMFGDCVYTSLGLFATSFALSVGLLFLAYFVYGMMAVLIQKRFPGNQDLFRRISVMLPVFFVMNILLVSGLYGFYNYLKPFECTPRTSNFWFSYVFSGMATTVITFLNEAVVNWDKWKRSVTETEQLKNAYQKTRLLGLKGQINPHFLFNCFNSLSSLINDDVARAEQFLDEMTKVHRYMLRGDDDELVTLTEELKFANSYLYLANVRFGEAINIRVNVCDDSRQRFLPPLSLQAILENVIYTNTATKSNPLHLTISSDGDKLMIKNSVQAKIRKDGDSFEEGIDNLISKYKLLHAEEVIVNESGAERTIVLPLFRKKEVRYEVL